MSLVDSQYHAYTLLNAVTLTASLNANLRTFQSYGHSKAEIEVFYTPAASSRLCTLFIEYSSDGTNWVPYTTLREDVGAYTINLTENPLTITGTTGGVTYGRKVHIPDLLQHLRVSVKEDGSASFGTATVKATFS